MASKKKCRNDQTNNVSHQNQNNIIEWA